MEGIEGRLPGDAQHQGEASVGCAQRDLPVGGFLQRLPGLALHGRRTVQSSTLW